MRKLILAATPLLALAGAASALAQGATQSPPAPNAGNSMPMPLGSVPPGARTTPVGRGGIMAGNNLGTTREADAVPGRQAGARPETNPDAPEGLTVPAPESR